MHRVMGLVNLDLREVSPFSHHLPALLGAEVCCDMRIFLSYYLILLSILATSMAMTPGTARAAQEIVLTADQSQMMKLPQSPATLVVGNPSVADVTIDGNTLFFHPRGYGLTNVLALDAKGRKLGDYLVRVIYDDSYSVSMYGPAGRQTYSCRRDCEPTLRIGDEKNFFTDYTSQASGKNTLASGQAMGEDMLTPPTVTAITSTPGVMFTP